MAITGNGTYVKQELEQWAYNHDTSFEIVMAISDICRTEKKMQRVWETPTKAEEKKLIASAWKYAGDDDVLYWGWNEFRREESKP